MNFIEGYSELTSQAAAGRYLL